MKCVRSIGLGLFAFWTRYQKYFGILNNCCCSHEVRGPTGDQMRTITLILQRKSGISCGTLVFRTLDTQLVWGGGGGAVCVCVWGGGGSYGFLYQQPIFSHFQNQTRNFPSCELIFNVWWEPTFVPPTELTQPNLYTRPNVESI